MICTLGAPAITFAGPELCIHADNQPHPILSVAAAGNSLNTWYAIGQSAIVLQYDSVYAVHTPLAQGIPIRSQPGSFFVQQILLDLECLVNPAQYNFVLLYSVQEVPGWIHSGARGVPAPAKNIGLPNSQYGAASTYPAWPKLLLATHMNSIQLIAPASNPEFGKLTAMHEIGHAWGVFWAMDSPGPRGWQPDDPVAWLGSCCGHWSWNWSDTQLPGMMYSAPTQPFFNDFDLYAMGLMSYGEATGTSYQVYEESGTSSPGQVHNVDLEDLLFSLSLRGPVYYEGNGRRVPDLDPDAAELRALIVVIKGSNEAITPAHESAILELADNLPDAWFTATGGRSSLSVGVFGSNSVDGDDDTVLDCVDNCPESANPTQQDTDDDDLGDACDPCPHVSNPTLWDLDHRQGFNLHDFQVFQACFSGPFPLTPGCGFVDFSGGGKVDLSDYIPLGELMTGLCGD